MFFQNCVFCFVGRVRVLCRRSLHSLTCVLGGVPYTGRDLDRQRDVEDIISEWVAFVWLCVPSQSVSTRVQQVFPSGGPPSELRVYVQVSRVENVVDPVRRTLSSWPGFPYCVFCGEWLAHNQVCLTCGSGSCLECRVEERFMLGGGSQYGSHDYIRQVRRSWCIGCMWDHLNQLAQLVGTSRFCACAMCAAFRADRTIRRRFRCLTSDVEPGRR